MALLSLCHTAQAKFQVGVCGSISFIKKLEIFAMHYYLLLMLMQAVRNLIGLEAMKAATSVYGSYH